MKPLRKKTRLLIEQVLNNNFLDANSTLASLIMEAEENREEEVANSLGDDADADADADIENDDQEVNTDEIDEPTDGSPNLGDSLDQSVDGDEDDVEQAVGEGEMTEMSNDVVEINCEINQKIISKLYDKISNLKTTLNAKDIDHDTREYISLETKLSYYGNKLEELQSKTNPAIDQEKVQVRVDIIDAALKSLETEIGDSNKVPDVESSDEVEDSEEGGEEGGEGEGEEESPTEEGGEEAPAEEEEEGEGGEESPTEEGGEEAPAEEEESPTEGGKTNA